MSIVRLRHVVQVSFFKYVVLYFDHIGGCN